MSTEAGRASEANTRKAEELLTRKRCPDYCQDCEACQLDCQMVALALDAAEQRGREEAGKLWVEGLSTISQQRMQLQVAEEERESAEAKLLRLRERIAEKVGREYVAWERVCSRVGQEAAEDRERHGYTYRVLRSLLTNPDQQESQVSAGR